MFMMRHLKKIIFILQALAVILYPTATASLVSAASRSDEPIITESHHVGVAVHDHQHESSPGNADEMLMRQASSSSDSEEVPCCCAGPAGLCAIFASIVPDFDPLGHDNAEARLPPAFAGIHPALLPHPPKASS